MKLSMKLDDFFILSSGNAVTLTSSS